MKKRKVKLKKKNIFLFLIIISLFIGAGIYIYKSDLYKKIDFLNSYEFGYLASDNKMIDLYEIDSEEKLNKSLELVRGTKVKTYKNQKLTFEENEYIKVEYDDKTFYVLLNQIVKDKKKVVLEKELYVRTSYNLLKDLEGNLGNLLRKGDKVNILGYENLLDDGSVDIYQVSFNEDEGYLYSKYLVATEEEARSNYDEDGIYKIHASRADKLGGGSGANLDYFPREKGNFEDNKMPSEVYALYINGSKGIKNSIDSYIEYAKTTKINAFVVDIKDNAVPAYNSSIYEKYSETNYKYAFNSIEDYKYAINRLKEENFYVIGRITTFKDDYYALDNPDNAIKKTDGSLLKHNGSYWPSAYNRDVWKFNVDLAKEAIDLFGFNEIQFDYCRFPDRLNTYEKAGTIDYRNTYQETKSEAVQKFLMYATDELHKLGVYVSADVFGESSWGYITAYGQYWPAMSNVVDAISAMPYTDHFGSDSTYWTNPYQTMYNWGKTAAERQKEIPSPAVARTWITAYDTPYWKPTTT